MAVCLLLGLSGCQTATLQSTSDDAASKSFATEGGKAKIYVCRLSGLAGGARVEPVFIDGRMLGQNGSGTFLVADVSPGHHTVATTASSVVVDTMAGATCFVRQKHSAWGPTSSVEQVTQAEGKQGVASCKRAAALY
jgi:Protein of unknown function (DUF2846)